ncbi:hypothetical protein R3P38DRAFT_2764031 [Favolaschia claudopus]|uniref:Uncharacterized protein n=1 Tax=Favolaschia claudopus TaxID=2862362 RepID=A0AAW0DL01_9AGAR
MTVQKNIAGTKYVPNGLQTMVSGVLARFRDIDFNGYRHCVNPNTPIEAIRNPGRQHQSRDVKVGNNPTARTLSFGKEIEEHAIQQGSVRVNNGIQQDIGELAAHSSPLERKGNQGHRSQGKDVSKQQPTIIRPETTEPQYNTSNTFKSPKVRGFAGIRVGHWQRGREFGGALIQTPPNPTDLVEFGGARGIGRGKQSDPQGKNENGIL